jgi:anti-sigma B factor antagonist
MTSAPHGLLIDVDVDGDELLVSVKGELDMSTTPQLTEALGGATDQPVTTVTLDMSEVSFIDSSGLRVLVLSGRALADAGRTLRIGPRSEMVSRVLTMTNLDNGSDAFEVLPASS